MSIFHWFPVSPTYSHLGTVSSSHAVYSGYLLSTYIAVESEFSQLWSMESGLFFYIVCSFLSTITGVVVWSFKTSSLAVAQQGLFDRVTQASLIQILTSCAVHLILPVGGRVTQHVNNQSPSC